MCSNDDNIHLLPLVDYEDPSESSDVSEHNDSLEIVSLVDDDESEIIDITEELTSYDQVRINDGHNGYSLCDDPENHHFRYGVVDNIRSSFNVATNHEIPTVLASNYRCTFDDSFSESDSDASNHHPIEQHRSNSHNQSSPSPSHSSSTTTNDILSTLKIEKEDDGTPKIGSAEK